MLPSQGLLVLLLGLAADQNEDEMNLHLDEAGSKESREGVGVLVITDSQT